MLGNIVLAVVAAICLSVLDDLAWPLWRRMRAGLAAARRRRHQDAATPNPPARQPAAQNACYRLMSSIDADQKIRRAVWNRLMSRWLSEDQRQKLMAEGLLASAERAPYRDDEIDAMCERLAETDGSEAAVRLLQEWKKERPFEITLAMTEFKEDFDVDDFIFSVPVSFRWSRFNRNDFARAVFCDKVDFTEAEFGLWGKFEGTRFFAAAVFKGAQFRYPEPHTFENAKFFAGADFVGADFTGEACFDGALFSGETDFTPASTVFSRKADFTEAVFRSDVDFVNATFKNETFFERAKFKQSPPNFQGATLHQGTYWQGAEWPPLPSDHWEAAKFMKAYQRLKLEMDGAKRHDDEMFFFANELQCKRVSLGKLRGLPIAAYGWLCGFGRDFMRPLYWLALVVVAGVLYFLIFPVSVDHWSAAKAAGLSLVNTLSVFGFRREFIDADVLNALTGPQRAFSALQTVFGLVLLFLFGLATRNYFRMK